MIDEEFGRRLRTAFNAPAELPVHQLFNEWWSHAPAAVTQSYVDVLMSDERFRSLLGESQFSPPLDLVVLGALPVGSLGRCYRDWIVDNGLAAAIAADYRRFHDSLERSGRLEGMPVELRFAILRGFQVHDFMHVLTGYGSSSSGELALQAFSLAQFPFPYFGMWMSVVTTRMTFHEPRMIAATMDSITDGWHYGRQADNLMVQPWEDLLSEPVAALRQRFNVEPSPVAARMIARAAG